MNQKIIKIIMGGILLTTLPVWAKIEPEGGSVITAHKSTDEGCTATTCNGRKFYVSDKKVNWWTAITWCHANGMELASLAEACPPGNIDLPCPNLKDISPSQA